MAEGPSPMAQNLTPTCSDACDPAELGCNLLKLLGLAVETLGNNPTAAPGRRLMGEKPKPEQTLSRHHLPTDSYPPPCRPYQTEGQPGLDPTSSATFVAAATEHTL
ncbi:Hypothetical predicted protein [Pelobates cultripes]|uniref:Uncharacterized protein n=1 Tax=Pelobates cultripes TaxID=61616 RepID=A0AAD1W1P8_PELCU|nr:Hypothetical predicted protein [Pelobates cultripes]